MRLEKSVIIYGMHQIPIKIGNTQKSATGDLLHMCCQLCDSKVNQKYHCSNERCSNHELIEKATSNTNRYFQQDKEHRKVLTKEQLGSIKESGTMVEVLGRVKKQEFGGFDISKRINKSWFCVPDDTSNRGKKFIKPYATLLAALQTETDSDLVVKVYSRGKEKLGIMSSDSSSLVVYGISFEDETNSLESVIPLPDLTPEEREMGKTFIESLKQVELKDIVNDEREKLFQLLEGEIKDLPELETEDEMGMFTT